MNDTFQPIDTPYGGCLFRSRLEARWAVFFDKMDIKWEYEPELFSLTYGAYLPDFWLPCFSGGIFAEVKHEGGNISKAIAFSIEYKYMVWMCIGPPDFKEYDVYDGGGINSPTGNPFIMKAIPLFAEAYGENRFFTCPELDLQPTGIRSKENLKHLTGEDGEKYITAVKAAQSARFGIYEPGEINKPYVPMGEFRNNMRLHKIRHSNDDHYALQEYFKNVNQENKSLDQEDELDDCDLI